MARMPKDSVLFDLYTALGDRLARVGQLVPELVSDKKRSKTAEEIGRLESEADALLVQIIDRADAMLITPFDRADIHALANMLDDSIDELEKAADLTILHKVEEFPKGVEALADCVRSLSELTATSVARLRSLKDLDFYFTEADKIEDEGDRLHRRITARLFSGDYDALTVLRVEGVINALEESLNNMARVARIVRSVASQER